MSNNEVVMDFEENAPFDVCVERIAIQTAEPCLDVSSSWIRMRIAFDIQHMNLFQQDFIAMGTTKPIEALPSRSGCSIIALACTHSNAFNSETQNGWSVWLQCGL